MADISVTLGLDDRSYQSSLKNAEGKGNAFGSKMNSVLKSVEGGFTKVTSAVEGLNQRFDSFANVITGLGLTALIGNIMQTSSETVTMAKAFGISTERLLEMQVAAQGAGMNADQLNDRIGDLTTKINDAIRGNQDLRNAFSALGVTFADMRNKSPDEIFNSVAVALSRVTDDSKRAALASKLLGDEGKKVAWGEYVANIVKTYGSLEQYAASQENLAKVSKEFSQQIELIKLAFGEILSPILSLIKPTGDFTQNLDNAKVAAYGLGGALALFAASSTIRAVSVLVDAFKGLTAWLGLSTGATAVNSAALNVNTPAAVRNAEAQLAVAAANLASAKSSATLIMQNGVLTVQSAGLAAAQTAHAEATAALAAAQAAANATSIRLSAGLFGVTTSIVSASAATKELTLTLGTLTISFGSIATAAAVAAGAIAMLYSPNLNEGEDAAIAKTKKLDAALKTLTESQLENYYKLSQAEQQQIQDQLIAQQEAKKTQEILDKLMGTRSQGKGTQEAIKDLTLGSQERVKAIQRETDLLLANNERTKERIRLEMNLASQGKATRESALAAFDAETAKRQKMYEIQGKISEIQFKLATDENARSQGLGLLLKAYQDQLEKVSTLTDGIRDLKYEELTRLDALEMQNLFYDKQYDALDQIKSINDEIRQLTMTADQKRIDNIDIMIAKEKELAIRKRKSQLNLKPEDTLDDAEIQQINNKIEQSYDGVKKKTQEAIDKSRDWSTGWKNAFEDYAERAMNSSTQAAEVFNRMTSSMEDAIVNFAKTGKFEFKSFVTSVLEDIMRLQIRGLLASLLGGPGSNAQGGLLSGIGSWIGDLFSSSSAGSVSGGSGWMDAAMSFMGFANGGTIPHNGPVIVGERGPEILTGAGGRSVIPNNMAFGDGTQQAPQSQSITNNYITNNINAVDSKSVAKLFADNRMTLLGNVRQAEKELPNAGR